MKSCPFGMRAAVISLNLTVELPFPVIRSNYVKTDISPAYNRVFQLYLTFCLLHTDISSKDRLEQIFCRRLIVVKHPWHEIIIKQAHIVYDLPDLLLIKAFILWNCNCLSFFHRQISFHGAGELCLFKNSCLFTGFLGLSRNFRNDTHKGAFKRMNIRS